MSARDVGLAARDAIETAVPAARSVRWTLYLAGILLAAAAIGIAYWLLIARPRAARQQAASAKAEAATATGTAGAAQDAIGVTRDVADQHVKIDITTRSNDYAIRTAPGTTVALDPALDAAGRAALCLRRAYSGDPGCAALRGDGGSIGPAGADAGSGPPR